MNKSTRETIQKVFLVIILTGFISASVESPSFSQVIDPMPFMPRPGMMVRLSPEFTPAFLKGIVIHPENALKFDFIIYKGDTALSDVQKKEEYTKLTKYFLASLAIPDNDQWVNLSPFEKDRIIKDDFGKTEMGRDLLAQDYMLKQITASLIYPEDNLGKKFWEKVYTQAQQQYGTTNIPVNTFNKVWILPDDALIYEKGNTVFVLKNHLRVMLEEDYLALEKSQSRPLNRLTTHSRASQIIRQIVLPALEKEINEGKNFAPLRQVYSGMLLAAWYKRALKESLLSKIYADKAKVKGIDQPACRQAGTPCEANEQIYRQYLKAYRKGVFNFIKEDMNKYTNETIPRKYFSGGARAYVDYVQIVHITSDPAQLAGQSISDLDFATVAAEVTGAGSTSRRIFMSGGAVSLAISLMAGLTKAQVRMGDSESARRRKGIIALTKILTAVDPNIDELGDIYSLIDNYRDAILKVLTAGEIQELPWDLMLNVNNGDKVQKELLRIMFDISKERNDTKILNNMITQAVNAFLKQTGPSKPRNPYLFENYLAFLQKVITDPGFKALLTEKRVQRIRAAITTTSYLIKIEDITNDKEANSNMQRAMESGDEIFQHLVMEGNKNLEWQQAVKSNLIDKANDAGRMVEARQLFLEDYSAFILRGDLARTHWFKDGGYNSEENIEARRAFFNQYIFPGKVQAKPTTHDLHEQLMAINDAAMGLDPAMSTSRRRFLSVAALAPLVTLYPWQKPGIESNRIRGGIQQIIFNDNKRLFVGQQLVYTYQVVFSGGAVSAKSIRVEVASIRQEVPGTGEILYVIDLINLEGPKIFKPVYPSPRVFKDENRPSQFEDVPVNSVVDRAQAPGGIDLNSANLAMTIKRDGKGVPLPFDQQDMALLNLMQGLEPVILSIQPANNIPNFSDLFKSING